MGLNQLRSQLGKSQLSTAFNYREPKLKSRFGNPNYLGHSKSSSELGSTLESYAFSCYFATGMDMSRLAVWRHPGIPWHGVKLGSKQAIRLVRANESCSEETVPVWEVAWSEELDQSQTQKPRAPMNPKQRFPQGPLSYHSDWLKHHVKTSLMTCPAWWSLWWPGSQNFAPYSLPWNQICYIGCVASLLNGFQYPSNPQGGCWSKTQNMPATSWSGELPWWYREWGTGVPLQSPYPFVHQYKRSFIFIAVYW